MLVPASKNCLLGACLVAPPMFYRCSCPSLGIPPVSNYRLHFAARMSWRRIASSAQIRSAMSVDVANMGCQHHRRLVVQGGIRCLPQTCSNHLTPRNIVKDSAYTSRRMAYNDHLPSRVEHRLRRRFHFCILSSRQRTRSRRHRMIIVNSTFVHQEDRISSCCILIHLFE